MIKRIAIVVALTVLIGACASGKTQISPDVDSKNTTITTTNKPATSNIDSVDSKKSKPEDKVTFVDLNSFDDKFSKVLKTDQDQVEIKMISKFSTNDIPDRLGTWLYMVEKKGGKVEVQSTAPQTRGIPGLGIGIGLVLTVYKKIRESLMYKPTKNYDAILYYDPTTGLVEKVLFTHKPVMSEP